MALRRNAHGQQAAIEGMRGLIEQLRASGKRRLPGVRVLASRFGVAYVTMAKAIRVLCAEGVLETVQGRGTFVQSTPGQRRTMQSVAPVRRRTWERVRDTVEQDLVRQVYPPGRLLPSAKELSRVYGVSYATLGKALASLESMGLLVPHGTGYGVADLGRQEGHGTLVVVARGATDLNRLSGRAQELFRIVQSECSKLNVLLRIAFYDHDSRGELRTSQEDMRLIEAPRESSVIGYLVFARGFETPFASGLAVRLGRSALPVSVLDESGDLVSPGEGAGGGPVRLFNMSSSPRSGLVVGRYLLAHGHRRIAYINAAHTSTWSRNRLAGLREAFRAGGNEARVYPFVTDRVELPERSGSLHGTVGEAIREIVVPDPERFGSLTPLLRRAFSGLTSVISGAVSHEVQRNHLMPLFEQAAARDDITAWVAGNDSTAVQCMDFLARHAIAVPSHISVVGFDDTLEAFLYKLTSYSHNYPAVVRAMLAHVLKPRIAPRRPRPDGPTEIEGFINRRETVGAVRGRSAA
ncbi:MAG: GntR family transcriptional regulator [Chitinivibrionales bacterium]|nr:GntR family transcriptional regulator [Chitinivibrionales bacterium]